MLNDRECSSPSSASSYPCCWRARRRGARRHHRPRSSSSSRRLHRRRSKAQRRIRRHRHAPVRSRADKPAPRAPRLVNPAVRARDAPCGHSERAQGASLILIGRAGRFFSKHVAAVVVGGGGDAVMVTIAITASHTRSSPGLPRRCGRGDPYNPHDGNVRTGSAAGSRGTRTYSGRT